MYLRDDDGEPINAECALDVIGGVDCVVVESSGGASTSRRVRRRNPAYNELVETILKRLRDARVSVAKIILDSARVAVVPEQARTVTISRPYPIDLSAVDIEQLRKEIGRKVAGMHRADGVSTSGNQQKRIRICLSRGIEPEQLIHAKPNARFGSEQEECDDPPEMGPTEKQQLQDARLGQGKFRNALLKRYRGRCVATGISHRDLLIASHIKPWRVSTNFERLDPWNGFLLSAMIDKLFDKGLISFSDDGRLIVSSRLPVGDCELCGLADVQQITVPPRSRKYLAYHRHHWHL